MEPLTHVGTFCPNPACPNYAKTEHATVIKHGTTQQGKQRFRCKTCGKTFNENKGTLFYRKQTQHDQILETLALLAEGTSLSGLARTKGFHPETILTWLEQAAAHAEAIEAVLLRDYHVRRGQLDGLWSYVQNKGQKNTTKKPTKLASSGVRP
jgi:transposase-like protein